MERIRDIQDAARRAARVIRSGGVLLSPTDTIYGLGCDPFEPAAVNRVIQLKGRPQEKGFLLLVGDASWIDRWAELPADFSEVATRVWPGPVTLLLRARAEAPAGAVGPEGKIGFRQPADPFLAELLARLGAPLLSTSANRSGEPPPQSLAGLQALFGSEVDLFLENGEPRKQPASTVLDLTADPPRILRAGAGEEAVREWLESRSRH